MKKFKVCFADFGSQLGIAWEDESGKRDYVRFFLACLEDGDFEKNSLAVNKLQAVLDEVVNRE